VIAAADAVLLDPAVVERRAAVRAARVHEARTPGAVAKEDQLLAEHAHLARRRTRIAGQPDRVPVAAQQLAHRRAGADLGELALVRRRRQAVGRSVVHSGFAPEARM
jgi:hypothetical protein